MCNRNRTNMIRINVKCKKTIRLKQKFFLRIFNLEFPSNKLKFHFFFVILVEKVCFKAIVFLKTEFSSDDVTKSYYTHTIEGFVQTIKIRHILSANNNDIIELLISLQNQCSISRH